MKRICARHRLPASRASRSWRRSSGRRKLIAMDSTLTIQADHIKSEAHRASRRHLPGEVGIWVFVCCDLYLEFGAIFGCFLWDRAENPALFAQSREALSPGFGLLNTLVLLTSSLFVALGVQALRTGNRPAAIRMFVWARTLGLIFVGIKIYEYSTKFSIGLTPMKNEFFMYYYAITGLHLAHVLIGLAVLTSIIRTIRLPAPQSHEIRFAEVGAIFWHMVDLLWIVLFPLLYLVV